MRVLLLATVILLPLTAMTADDMKPYPPPEAGFERLVFRLPRTDNDDDRKVEIEVGKIIPVDCNRTMFMGDLEKHTVEGWGYSYYIARQITGPATTLMACGDDQKTDQFVPVRGEGFLQRYNHKLPVVVYVPEGFEVRYRVWVAGEETQEATPE